MRNRLNIPAGEYDLPVMAYKGAEGTEDPKFIRLVFQASDNRRGRHAVLTISVTVSTLDASGILHGLQYLQGKGLIPIVPQAPKTRQ